MADGYFYGRMQKSGSKKRAAKVTRPSELRGVPDTGRIVKVFFGQGYGIIRLADGREIYFHRADIREGTSINDFEVGDHVAFERIDDRISGSRALGVAKRRRGGR
jgi:cold shock CspA family protein